MTQPYEELELRFHAWSKTGRAPYNMVACNSGTAALHLALEAYRFPRGAEVIVPEFTMVACARAVVMAELRPVFVDCGPDLLMNTDAIADAMTDSTVAIMPVHVYGRRSNLDPIGELADHHGPLVIIEDCAEAHGSQPSGVRRADVSCWSFYQNKIVAGEEGGMVCFQHEIIAAIARQLRCQGFTDDHDFTHIPRGHNYRMPNAQAKLIMASLAEADANIANRRRVELMYSERIPDRCRMPLRDVCWVYDIRHPSAPSLVKHLNARGIQARMGFKPMSSQPEFRGHYRQLNAWRMSQEIMYLPVHPMMTEPAVAQIVETLKAAPGWDIGS